MTEIATTAQNLRKLALAAVSMPAAIGLLDKYDARLGLSALIKKIVRNYEAVLTGIWDWLKSVLPLPPDIDVLFWSFFILILILTPALAEWLRHAVQGRKMVFGRPRFWGIASALAFAGYCIAFATGPQLIGAGGETVVTIALFVPFMALCITGFVLIEERFAPDNPDQRAPPATRTNPLLKILRLAVIVVVFGAYFKISDWASRPLAEWVYGLMGEERLAGARGLALFASLCLMAVFAFGNLRTPAYVFFWLFGIVFIDTLATEILPSISGWLDQAICPDGACAPS